MKSYAEADAVLATYASGVYVALLSAAPALDGTSLTELAFVGYARQPLAIGAAHTHVDGSGRTVRRRLNSGAITFGPVQAPAAAGITHVALMSALTGGTLRRVIALASPLPPPQLGTLTIPVGGLAIHEA